MNNSVEFLVENYGLSRYPAEQLSPILLDREEVLPVSFVTKCRYQEFCHTSGFEFITITLIDYTVNVYYLDETNKLGRFIMDVSSPNLAAVERKLLQELASTKLLIHVNHLSPYVNVRQSRPN